jgi:WD40 repeat protein
MDTTCMIWQVVQEYGSSVNLDTMPMHILYGHRACVTSVDICNELDLVVSAGLDGLINVHSIRSGSFVRSLSLHDTSILLQPKSNATVTTTSSSHPPQYRNLMVKLSNERHILVYACSSPSSLVENAASVANPVTSSSSATSLSNSDFQKVFDSLFFVKALSDDIGTFKNLN